MTESSAGDTSLGDSHPKSPNNVTATLDDYINALPVVQHTLPDGKIGRHSYREFLRKLPTDQQRWRHLRIWQQTAIKQQLSGPRLDDKLVGLLALPIIPEESTLASPTESDDISPNYTTQAHTKPPISPTPITNNSANTITLTTDGSYQASTGKGGWAAILQYGEYEHVLQGSAEDTTSNAMEIIAVIEGMSKLARPGLTIHVRTDSNYVVKGVTEWLPKWQNNDWRNRRNEPVSNRSLWQQLASLLDVHTVTFEHISREQNERADKLAKDARTSIEEIPGRASRGSATRKGKYRIYPNVAAAAIAGGYAVAYRIYVIMQARAFETGRQFATTNELRPYAPTLSDRQLRTGLAEAIKAGFLTYRNGVYKLVARKRVMLMLGVADPGRSVDLEYIPGNLAVFKAECYSGWHEARYDDTPPRDKIIEIWNTSLPTLIDWEQRVDIHVRARIVSTEIDPPKAGGDLQTAAAALADELQHQIAGRRVWLGIFGPHGGYRGGRRLMDNNNDPLLDFFRVQDEPAWEDNCTIRLCWQESNDYQSPLNRAVSGRAKWLKEQVKISDHQTPDEKPQGGSDDYDYIEPAKRFLDATEADKWQRRRVNRDRTVIIEAVMKDRVMGEFHPSSAATWGEYYN